MILLNKKIIAFVYFLCMCIVLKNNLGFLCLSRLADFRVANDYAYATGFHWDWKCWTFLFDINRFLVLSCKLCRRFCSHVYVAHRCLPVFAPYIILMQTGEIQDGVAPRLLSNRSFMGWSWCQWSWLPSKWGDRLQTADDREAWE